jgi:hypothetical protein
VWHFLAIGSLSWLPLVIITPFSLVITPGREGSLLARKGRCLDPQARHHRNSHRQMAGLHPQLMRARDSARTDPRAQMDPRRLLLPPSPSKKWGAGPHRFTCRPSASMSLFEHAKKQRLHWAISRLRGQEKANATSAHEVPQKRRGR